MTGTSTSNTAFPSPTHQDFHWIHGPGRNDALADFVEMANDISSGVNTCLQLFYRSELTREQNLDDEPEQVTAAAIGKCDAQRLLRLSLAATALLRHVAQEKIDWLNEKQGNASQGS